MSKNGIVAILTCVTIGMLSQNALAQATWEGSAGAIFLNRDTSYQGDVIVDNGHAPLIGSSQFETGFHGGFHTELTRHLHDTHSIVARYFAIDDWTEMASATSTNGAWLYGGVLGEGTISQIDGVFAADLNSFEVSLAHQHRDWLTLMAGFRWLSINETLHVDFFQGLVDYADYDGFVKNDLYGFQAGADVLFIDHGGPLTVDGVFKAGVYGNDVRYDGAYVNGATNQIVASVNKTSFVGEIGINGNLLLTDNIELNAGYNLLWVKGVGLLSEQLTVANWGAGTGITPDRCAFYHGAAVNITVLH